MTTQNLVRLQKVIADAGITSRRKAEDFILQGRVEVNGELIRTLGTKVNPTSDAIVIDGEAVDTGRVERLYLLLHKPRGVMTTLNDPEGRKTVMDFVQDVTERIYPVGRLDYLSEGLLLMTNDGEVANTIIHPRENINKVYEVKVFGAVTPEILKKLRNGVRSEVGFLKPKSVRVIKQLHAKTWLEFRLTDGRNREIRRLCEACGLTVDKLKRIAIGGLTVEGIKPGGYRMMTKKQLLDVIGLNTDGSIKREIEYESPKKSINLHLKGAQSCSAADNRAFSRYRKDTYFETIKEVDEKKKREIQERKDAIYKEREDKHQKRQMKKKKRLAKKADDKSAVHAQILKW